MPFRPRRLGDFLEAAYSLEADDQTWLPDVLASARAVWGRGGPAHGFVYDASDVANLRMHHVHMIEFSDEQAQCFERAVRLITPTYVARSFRSLLAHQSCREFSLPELLPFFEGMTVFGASDFMGINGLDPQGLGVLLAFWMSDPISPSRAEMQSYRRMAHHLAAAHRCRRRLRESQAGRSRVDATEGAEAILDARQRIVHAEGAAKEKGARMELVESSRARELVRRTGAESPEGLRRWRPLTRARWTLVDSFERGGARYVVARENQSQVAGLSSLSDRERQVIAYLALGQSTKETAYALGIADATVRVLTARAAAKLGVRSRAALLDHADVRRLRPARMTGGA
jgi:DNA-binding CsgD family transcriptional regulator